jgi:Saxitoxin biosynthesis operon protein SxtJ
MNSSSTDPSEIRRFGLFVALFFGILLGIALWRHRPFLSYALGALFFCGLGFAFLPGFLSPVYGRWLKIAHAIGKVNTLVLLTLAYYLVITPAALVKRVLGGKPLPVEPDKAAVSYWVSRSEPAQPKERFIKRY